MKKVLISLACFSIMAVAGDTKVVDLAKAIHATLLTGIEIGYNDINDTFPIILKDVHGKIYTGSILNPAPITHRLQINLGEECNDNKCKPIHTLQVFDVDGDSGVLANLLMPNSTVTKEMEQMLKLINEHGTQEEKERLSAIKTNISPILKLDAGRNLIIIDSNSSQSSND